MIPKPIPPLLVADPDIVDRVKAVADEHEARRTEQRPMRLAMLGLGPALRDPDKAADCLCACHPRPADEGLHDAGVSCPCQKTPEERKRAFDELLEVCRPSVEFEERERVRAAQFEATAAELGVEVLSWGGMAPFQIEGVVDGRRFYLRSRHDHWSLDAAGVEGPDGDPHARDGSAVAVAAGDDAELCDAEGLFDVTAALRVAVDRMRIWLARRSCEHVGVDDEQARWCAYCGVRLAEADAWR